MFTLATVVKRTVVLAVFALALVILLPTQTSYGETSFTYNVNSNGDSEPKNGACAAGGTCTLREAIYEANNHAGADTINIPANMTIVLTSGTQLKVTQDVTISGGSQTTTIVDGNNTTRVFNFAVFSGTHSMSNLTVRNGNCGSCNDVNVGFPLLQGGGGIYNEAGLTLTNVTVTNSRGTQGGGIFNANPGAVANASLTLSGVTISNNTQTSSQFGAGGGGLWNGSRLSGDNVTITGNTATTQGGGYYNNTNYDSTLSNFTISDNTGIYAGGINNDYNGGSAKITLNTGQIIRNSTHCCDNGQNTGGGGIVNNDGVMILNNVTIADNVSANAPGGAPSPGSYGAGIHNTKTMTLNGVTLSGNQASVGAAISNGNYVGWPNSLLIVNSTISGNRAISSAGLGGGIFMMPGSNATLTNVTISNNSAARSGGIEILQGGNPGTVTLKNTIIAGNTATVSSPDCLGSYNTLGYNLIGNTGGCSFVATTGDQLNVSAGLAALGNNGGPTLTMALSPGSKAIDAGTNTGCPSTDQRGTARPQNGRCDIGAFEFVMGSFKPSLFLPLIMNP